MRMPFLSGLLMAAVVTVMAGCASAGSSSSGTAATSPGTSRASPVGTSPASPASTPPGSPPASPLGTPPGSLPAGPPGGAFACGPPAVPAAGHRVLTLTSAQDGKTYCVTAGTTVLVLLKGAPGNTWGPIRASGSALRPSASGRMSLMIGVTGASFRAIRPGTSVISSTRPACPSTATPGGVPCDPAGAFRVTVTVRAS